MLNGQTGYYEVAIGKRAVYVRVHGLASMNNCLCLRDCIEHALADGHNFVIVDLKDCTGMDSTFMGVLASAATPYRRDPPPGVAVVNADKRLAGLLDSVGISELVYVDPAPFEPPQIAFIRLNESAPDDDARLACVHAAHRELIEVAAENEKVFGPFLSVLESEMKARGMI